jgi:hypothetical protein
MKMEAVISSETMMNSIRLHSVTTYQIVLFVVTTERKSNFLLQFWHINNSEEVLARPSL